MSTSNIEKRDRYASVTMSEEELMRRKRPDRPIWQMVEELLKEIPAEDLSRMPSDGTARSLHLRHAEESAL